MTRGNCVLVCNRLMPGTPTMRTSVREFDAVNLGDGALHMLDQRLDLGRKRVPMIDDEICMLVRDRGVADAKALESGAFDQARRVIPRADW